MNKYTIFRFIRKIIGYPLRGSLKYLKSLNRYNLIGVEVGVYKGNNANLMLKHLDIEKLYLIDSYCLDLIKEKDFTKSILQLPKNVCWKVSESNDYMIDWSVFKKEAEDKFKFYDNVKFIIKDSAKAINDIKELLDFVYIDGDHRYKAVKKDLELYYRKLKVGGVICGDDFSAEYNGVAKAVLEFSKKHDLKINGEGNDWWMVK